MSEIILKTYELLDELDKSEIIKTLTSCKERLLKNKEVLSLIEKYRISNEDNKLIIKKELFEIDDYKNYMKSYNELSMIIMRINMKFKEYTGEKKCKKETNNE